MDVLSYLSELIQTRKAVGISGLGTVFKKKIPGRYDAETHSFIPPSYTLDFTDEIKEESLLASFIGSKRNVSTDTAIYFINEFSADTLRRLNNEGSISFGDLGKLFKSGDHISFEPATSINYGFDFYGLPVVKDEKEQVPGLSPQVEDAEEKLPVASEEAPFIETEETLAETEEIPAETETTPAEETQETLQAEHEQISLTAETTLESVITDNERTEENPGDDEPVVVTAAEEEIVPHKTEQAPVAEETTLESVIADNESTEENPGNEQPEAVDLPLTQETTSTEQETTAEKTQVVPETPPVQETPPVAKETPVNPFAQYKKNEEQLREEIESLNFYRSKSPYLKSTGPGDEEVIMKLNKITAREDTEEVAATDPYPVYPAQVEEQKTMPAYLKILISIGILALMMGVLYQIKPDIFHALTGKAPAKKLGTAAAKQEAMTPVTEDSLTTDSIQKSGASLSPADTLIKTLPSRPADTATVYEIIGASMHDQKEADNFIALMKRSGIDAKVVTNMSGRRLKMSIATLKDEKTAKEELDRLSKKLKIPGIYIYRNKQK